MATETDRDVWYAAVLPFLRTEFTLLEAKEFIANLSADEKKSIYELAKLWKRSIN